MALSFREQTTLTQEGADYLAQGRERADFEEQLYERGLYKADVDRLGFEIDRELGERYGADLLAQLERSGSANNTTPLSTSVFADLMHRQKAVFVKERDARARELLRQEKTPEQIAKELAHPLYTREDALHAVKMELERQQHTEQGEEASGSSALLIGGGAIVLGLVLGQVFPGRIFYGLILIGIYYLVRGIAR